MSFEIRSAASLDELNKLFRARYEVFVEEKGYYPKNSELIIEDRYDHLPDTRNFIALIDGEMVGGVRAVEINDAETPIDGFFDFSDYFLDHDVRVIAGGMLFIRAGYRRTKGLASAMMTLFHDYALSRDVTHIIGVASPEAESLLLRYGYKRIVPRFLHTSKGLWVSPMLLDLEEQQPHYPYLQHHDFSLDSHPYTRNAPHIQAAELA